MRKKKIMPVEVHCQCGVCRFSFCAWVFPATRVSSHTPKMCPWGESERLHSPSLNECGCVWVCPAMQGCPVPDSFLSVTLSCWDMLWPPVRICTRISGLEKYYLTCFNSFFLNVSIRSQFFFNVYYKKRLSSFESLVILWPEICHRTLNLVYIN